MSKLIRVSDQIKKWLDSIKKKFKKKHGRRITHTEILEKLKEGESVET